MASKSKSERQVMRQRGPGLRNSNTVDFGLNMPFHTNREERHLMRQRGAGTREINNVDFGLAFPPASRSTRSRSRTPVAGRINGSIPSRSSARRRRNGSISQPRSTRANSRESSTSITEQRNEETRRRENYGELQVSKRRKTNEVQVNVPPRVASNARKSSAAAFMIAEEPDQPPEHGEDAEASLSQNAMPLLVLQDDDKENQHEHDRMDKLARKRRKRRSIVQHIGRKKKRTSATSSENSVLTMEEETRPGNQSVAVDDMDHTNEHNVTLEPFRTTMTSPANDLDFTESPDTTEPSGSKHAMTKVRRRKRKSVVLGPRRKKPFIAGRLSIEGQSHGNGVAEDDSFVSAESNTNSQLEGQDQMEQNETQPAKAQMRRDSALKRSWERRQKQRAVVSSPSPLRSNSDGEDADETYVYEPEPPTPAPKGQSKPRKTTQKRASGSATTIKSSHATFPILTHRLTGFEHLPIITEEGLQKAEDPLHLEHFNDRGTPNAIDILAQICRETIEASSEKLGRQTLTGESRVEIRRKRTTLEAFGSDLDQRFFDMSERFEHRLRLEARLRKIRREKAELQACWLEVRKERDEMALRADHLRRQNWENEERSKNQCEISELAQRMEIEVERGQVEENLELSIRTTAAMVSSKSNSGGLLERIKHFNSQLEGLAVTLASQ